MTPFRLALITDRALAGEKLIPLVAAALAAGVDAVQLRDHAGSAAEIHQLARELSAMTRHAGARFFVNDRVDIAAAVRAHGVQLGARSIPIGEARRILPPGALVGYSAHSAEEAEGAALAGADFVILAPVFSPISKSGDPRPPLGAAAVRRTAAALPIPVIALGGITAENAAPLMGPAVHGEAPVAGIAVIGAILGEPDPGAAAAKILRSLEMGAPSRA